MADTKEKAADDEPIVAGDVVTLKSGGPKMTVEGMHENQYQVHCSWFSGDVLSCGTFAVPALTKDSSAAKHESHAHKKS